MAAHVGDGFARRVGLAGAVGIVDIARFAARFLIKTFQPSSMETARLLDSQRIVGCEHEKCMPATAPSCRARKRIVSLTSGPGRISCVF